MAIESPVEVLRRLREQARQERLARAQAPHQAFMQARTPGDRETAFGAQVGTALGQYFSPAQDEEQSPEVQQARQRAELLNVAPDDIAGIKSNIQVAAEKGDYEVANYLTNLYFKAQQLAVDGTLAQAKLTPAPADEVKFQGDLAKNLEDARKLRAQGRGEEASIVEEQVANKKAEQEAETYKKRREEADIVLAQAFGLDLEKDLDSADVTGPFQSLADSFADRSVYAGEKISDIRRDLRKYFEYSSGTFNDEMKFSQTTIDDVKKGRLGFGFDEKSGRHGLYSLKDGAPTKFISWIDRDMVDRYGLEKDPTLNDY